MANEQSDRRVIRMPQPLEKLSPAILSGVRYVLTDFDDTLTLQGKLPAQTLSALYALQRAGIQVIPVTGGCAGWSDMMVRVLPVAGVVSEGGGVFLQPLDGSIHYHYYADESTMKARQSELLASIERLLPKYPALKLARDQAYRLTDVAVDYGQDIQPPAVAQKDQLLAELRSLELNAKASSIHINVCQASVDKYSMSHHVLRDILQVPDTLFTEQVLYVGDAPNDESMFARFPLSVGVANIMPHLPSLTHRPAYITAASGGLGFAELVSRLVSAPSD